MQLFLGGIIGPIGIILLTVLIFLPFMWAIYHITKQEKGTNFLLWIIVVLCLPFIGPALYYFTQYSKKA